MIIGHMETQLALPVDATDQGETRLYRLTFPFLPPSKNVYDGFLPEWKSGVKRKWYRHVAEQAAQIGLPQGVHKVGLAATLVFASKNRRDLSNYAATLWHFVPDGLQRCGVLLDDRDGCVEYGPNLGVKFAYDLRANVPKSKRQRTIVAVAVHIGDGHA